MSECVLSSVICSLSFKVHVTVWCCWEKSRRAFKQVMISCDNDAKPTHLDALRALRAKVEAEHCSPTHEGDPKAQERHLEIQRSSDAALGTPTSSDAFNMLALGQAALRRAAEKAKLDEERVRKAYAAEVAAVSAREKAEEQAKASRARAEELRRPQRKKRQKTSCNASRSSSVDLEGQGHDAHSTTEAVETDDEPSWSSWTLPRWRKHESEMQKRRCMKIDDTVADQSLPRKGNEKQGWRWHWRRGLVGSVQDWAEGSRFRVAFMLAELAAYFEVEKQVVERLGFSLNADEVSAFKVDCYIVDRVASALHQLRLCRTEEERQDYGVVLAAVAPTREAKGCAVGMIAAVCKRLRVPRGVRYIKAIDERRPYAMEQAISRRGRWDNHLQNIRAAPFKVGDSVISRSRLCTIMAIDCAADTCTLRFQKGNAVRDWNYTCIYKPLNAPMKSPFPKGSARLRHAPVSLRPSHRDQRSDEKSETTRLRVVELFESEGARSPSMRDEVRRRVGVGLYETAQALYIYSRFKALYRLFCERFPACSFALFKQLKPWYVRRAKQETCLCKHCENCKVHKEVMSSLVELFKDVVGPPCLDCEDDAEDAGDNDNDEDRVEAQGWRGKVELMKLLRLGGLQSKADMIKFVLCEGALEGAGKTPCIEGACSRCGFDKIWSKGLRPHVVDAYGNIRPSTPIEFQNIVSWTRASTSSRVSTEASAPKAPKYEAHSGTVTQFLDAVERDVFRKYPHHRHTVTRQKAMSAQFARNCTPGWLRCAVDFAMDGEIPPPGGRAAQSDHWSPVTYTLFVMVVSWLERESWVSRDSNLKIGDLVTVEPPEQSTVGSVDAVPGSYFARHCTSNAQILLSCCGKSFLAMSVVFLIGVFN
mmetsp:Transcript_16169/g.40727  ORF Transcript_16169/g.40727 Transcript_16169/m.40727 type:complete len:875 (-) Transcript_16169:94-2718(-)